MEVFDDWFSLLTYHGSIKIFKFFLSQFRQFVCVFQVI